MQHFTNLVVQFKILSTWYLYHKIHITVHLGSVLQCSAVGASLFGCADHYIKGGVPGILTFKRLFWGIPGGLHHTSAGMLPYGGGDHVGMDRSNGDWLLCPWMALLSLYIGRPIAHSCWQMDSSKWRAAWCSSIFLHAWSLLQQRCPPHLFCR